MLYYRTGIETFDSLLLSHKSIKATELEKNRGLAFDEKSGFFGAVFGVAGSGKSIMALQIASLCVADEAGSGVYNDDGQAVAPAPPRSAIYITQEDIESLKAKVQSFGWINSTQAAHKIRTPGDAKFLNLSQPALHLARFDLAPEAQLDILRNIFDAVARAAINETNRATPVNGGEKSEPDPFTLICFDNGETVVDTVFSDLLRSSPHDKNFYKAIRAFCRQRKLHLLMFFEEADTSPSTSLAEPHAGAPRQPMAIDVANTAQAYAADLVVRLGSYEFPSGYKERSLEIVKAKNQYHRRGRHHFSIVPGESSEADSRHQPGISIYESLPTQLYKLRDAKPPHLPPSTNLGIASLDERIAGRAPNNYLSPGTVSVLVSDLDKRAQEIALHFAYRLQQVTNASGFQEQAKSAVYISLLNSWPSLVKVLSPFVPAEVAKAPDVMATPAGFVHLEPEHISEGKLLQDISYQIDRRQNEVPNSSLRVVVDNLYALEAKYPLIQNPKHFITALFALLRSKKVVALVIDSADIGVGGNPLDESFAAGLGQNVFLLRHVELHARERSAFSVVRLLDADSPDSLWEIVSDSENRKLHAVDTFRYYKQVEKGVAAPVKVRMSLHADAPGSPLDRYISEKQEALKSSLGYELTVDSYSPERYAHVHSAFTPERHQPLSDCHVISIDETWIEELIQHGELEDLADRGQYRGAVTACHDLALSYVAKGITNPAKIDIAYRRNFALPDRNNCGVLLVSDHAAKHSYFEKAPWQNGSKLEGNEWTTITELKNSWLNGKLEPPSSNVSPQNSLRPPVFFTFCRDQAESCVSFLLELAVCCVNKDETLVDNDRNICFESPTWIETLQLFVELLSDVDREEIAAAKFRATKDEPPAVISRQWYNTCFVRRPAGAEFERPDIRELPKGKRGTPGVVSGAWYFGILRGSAAKDAGIDAILQFTSPEDRFSGEDVRKANLGIGLPVRREFYQSPGKAVELVNPIPYAKRFQEIGDLAKKEPKERVEGVAQESNQEFPFYRMRIRNYRQVMPILWGLMVQAARLAERSGTQFSLSDPKGNAILKAAKERYTFVLNEGGK